MKTKLQILLLLGLPAVLFAEKFYIDPVTGNDTNPGTSPGRTWQSLSRVNSYSFSPGDTVLFKSGAVWTGILHLKGQGSQGKPTLSGSGIGIWTWSSDNCIVQFNEVTGTYGKKDSQAFDSDWNGWASGTHFYNNIVYTRGSFHFNFGSSKENTFSHNLWFGKYIDHPADQFGVFQDPLFRGPYFTKPDDFLLRKGSPAASKGMRIQNNGYRDYWGNRVSENNTPTIGAFEFNKNLK